MSTADGRHPVRIVRELLPPDLQVIGISAVVDAEDFTIKPLNGKDVQRWENCDFWTVPEDGVRVIKKVMGL